MGIIKFRESKTAKGIAVYLLLNLLVEIIYPSTVLALTGGPSQPESQGFTPVGTSEMVDNFTGDFNYNIPLVDVGGYPINISYSGSASMDQEASWVGMGWSITPGVINRSMRSVPDDFDGELVKTEFNTKPNNTFGINTPISAELFGSDKISMKLNLGVSYNNYNGFGFKLGANLAINAGDGSKGPLSGSLGVSAAAGSDGVDLSPSVSFESKIKSTSDKEVKLGVNIGAPFNSRAGLSAMTIGASLVDNKRAGRWGELTKGEETGSQTNKGGVVTKTFSEGNISGSIGGSSISFSSPSYTPQYTMPMMNTNVSFSLTMAVALFGFHPNIKLNGYYSGQHLKSHEASVPAFGYLFSENGQELDNAMHDFNREKDGGFTEKTPLIPLTNYTYDILSVSGQGIGGMYRPFRNHNGMVYDNEVINEGGSLDIPGIEIGVGWNVHGGADINGNYTNTRSGKWKTIKYFGKNNGDNNPVLGIYRWKGKSSETPLYENYYYKQAGEKTIDEDEKYFNSIGGFKAVKVGIDTNHSDVPTLPEFWSNFDEKYPMIVDGKKVNGKDNLNTIRQPRNQAISILNGQEASQGGISRAIQIFKSNEFTLGQDGNYIPTKTYSRVSYEVEGGQTLNTSKHISELTALRNDGARYVYGIPAYNTKQVESSFAVNGIGNESIGVVDYNEDEDSRYNTSGLDNYYNKTTMPAFAHSYLLTEILSSDYVDVDNVKGPSDEDYGSYTKFNYTRIDGYKWRTPFTKANYNEGMKSEKNDNKGSYIYGEKDIWYLHSIVTKTHVAEFVLEDRDDSYGVASQRGDGFGKSLKRLKEIRLYAKQDKIKNGSKAVPIKVVHFEYTYDLCPGTPNNIKGGGKLTLKKLWFTYGSSNKGKLSAYEFNYEGKNPSYNLKGYDRWGNYKPNLGTPEGLPDDPASTSDFPYVDQTNRSEADKNASAWIMTSIKLPSGGKIKLEFESDDYAFVQNKRAMQMMKIDGVGNNPSDIINNPELYDSLRPKRFLFFKLQNPIDDRELDPDAIVRNKYIKDDKGEQIKDMYFRFFMKLSGRFADNDAYEFVPGYVKIKTAGVARNKETILNNQFSYGYIELEESFSGVYSINSISKTGWDFTKLYLPKVAYGKTDATEDGIIQVAKGLASVFRSIIQFVEGMDFNLMSRSCSKKFKPEKSYVRLFSPEYKKVGGGYRVKSIKMSDEWQDMAKGSKTMEYGQEYSYTTTDSKGNVISSGVASYEPMMGGDENPFRNPVRYEVEKTLAPDDKLYKETPFGESFFPSPSVGYSKVTVTNLRYNNINRNATGKIIHEFYTSKEFPTIVEHTNLNPNRKKPPFVFKMLKVDVNDFMTASQGFSVILNDMHGKQKGQLVYAENNNDLPISRVTYKYKTKTTYSDLTTNQLDNDVLVINKTKFNTNGSYVDTRRMGVEYDFVLDSRRSETVTYSGSLKGNLDAFLVAIFPIAVPILLPGFSREMTGFKSISATKVINQYGILEEVIAEDLGSKVSTKNLAYDAYTGEVLVTETVNQFNDPIYNLNYPAHWAYDRMGHAYKNIGLELNGVDITNLPNANKYFVSGDEVLINGNTIAWVYEVYPNSIRLMDEQGTELGFTKATIKVLRSGRRNIQSTSIGQVTMKVNPLKGNFDKILDNFVFEQVINANSIEFTETGKVFCECGLSPNTKVNPYKQGLLGVWRPLKSHLYLTERIQTRENDNTNIRKDGIYKTFSPFWMPPLGSNTAMSWMPNYTGWTWTSEVTIYSPFGLELENKDALNRYSSATYGYHNTLPTAVSSNAKYREVAFDNFEDYDFGGCNEHFNYKKQKSFVKEKASHTGKRSISVPAKSKHTLTKPLEKCFVTPK
ncbi:MAG: hypothetical protein ACK48V_00850 [Crocinitomicaceae bacterium]|jgi:hypothetical protein